MSRKSLTSPTNDKRFIALLHIYELCAKETSLSCQVCPNRQICNWLFDYYSGKGCGEFGQYNLNVDDVYEGIVEFRAMLRNPLENIKLKHFWENSTYKIPKNKKGRPRFNLPEEAIKNYAESTSVAETLFSLKQSGICVSKNTIYRIMARQ